MSVIARRMCFHHAEAIPKAQALSSLFCSSVIRDGVLLPVSPASVSSISRISMFSLVVSHPFFLALDILVLRLRA